MAFFDDFGKAYSEKFVMFMAAVSGERALAAAAGLPPGSVKQMTRAYMFKTNVMTNFQEDGILLHAKLFAEDKSDLAKRSMVRFAMTHMQLNGIALDVIAQTSRQARFGLKNPLDALSKRRAAGAVGELALRRMAIPEFKTKDSAGRSWDADKLVRLIARDMAYQNFIDSEFNKAIQAGAKEVRVIHPDIDHPNVGMTVALDGEWLRQRDTLFHINSSMTIEYGAL